MSNQYDNFDPIRKIKSVTKEQHEISNNHLSVVNNTYLNAATSANTRKAYRSDIRHYESWGGVLPAATEQIVTYLLEYATQLNSRTLMRRLTALKQWHVCQGFCDPTENSLVHKTLSGIANTNGKPKNKAPAITADDLHEIVMLLQKEQHLRSHRDNALLQVGFFGAFRRSELVNINFDDLTFSKDGVKILIPRSKSDQQGDGQICALPYGTKKLCPILSLTNWLKYSQITNGPVFRKINRWDKIGTRSLTPLAVNQILQERAVKAGLPNAQFFSSHSLRRGLATSASRKGASIKAIMRQGRWRHVQTVLGYIEDSQQFEDNAAKAILQEEDLESETK